jgi:hypothetical protein
VFVKMASVDCICYLNDDELVDFIHVMNSDSELDDEGSSDSERSNVSTI